MGIVKEPLHIDFILENRPLTKEEEKQISEYIISQKKKELKNKTIRRIVKSKKKHSALHFISKETLTTLHYYPFSTLLK